jgi:hypothetical protein
MGTLSDAGYEIPTASELETDLTNEAIANVPGFTALPSELRTNLISEASLVSFKMENAASNVMNGVAPTYANDFMFRQFGQSFGLGGENPETLAAGDLLFTGPQGTYIPAGLICSDSGDTVEVTTLVDGIIGSGGEATISAQSETAEAILADTITVIQVPISGVTVNNPNAFTAGLPEETTAEYRARVQNTLSAPRTGQVGRAYELLEATTGVDARLIFFRPTAITIGGTTYTGIEAVVGGGDDGAVANALFNSFLETKKLISNPSDSDPDRTISYNVQVYNSTFPIEFTRPLLSTLAITLNLNIKDVTTTSQIVSGLLNTALTSYIDSLHVGEAINLNSLNKILFDTLATISVYTKNISSEAYTFLIDGIAASPTGGYLPVEFDQYFTLTSFTLNLTLS